MDELIHKYLSFYEYSIDHIVLSAITHNSNDVYYYVVETGILYTAEELVEEVINKDKVFLEKCM